MSAAVFSDLDGTLIYSKRYLHDLDDVAEVERIRSKPSAWMTVAAAHALGKLRTEAHFIPTSTRVMEQYGRLRLPGGPTEYAILANGGRIYVNGVEDQTWTDLVHAQSAGVTPPGYVESALTRELHGAPWVREIRFFDDIVCVTAQRGMDPDDSFYEMASAIATANGYTSYPQGRKTHLIPTHITKEAAATEIANRLGVQRTIASGDHGLDQGIMRWATDAIQPAHGMGFTGIRTTERSGARAAEEIVADFRRFAAA